MRPPPITKHSHSILGESGQTLAIDELPGGDTFMDHKDNFPKGFDGHFLHKAGIKWITGRPSPRTFFDVRILKAPATISTLFGELIPDGGNLSGRAFEIG